MNLSSCRWPTAPRPGNACRAPTPGRYELLCNLQNHYANGMYKELLVT